MLSSIIWREARLKAGYTGSLDNLLDMLNNVRLGTMLEESRKTGKTGITNRNSCMARPHNFPFPSGRERKNKRIFEYRCLKEGSTSVYCWN